MTWVDQTNIFNSGDLLTSTQLSNVRDNQIAIANRSASAPFLGGGWGRELIRSITTADSHTDINLANFISSNFTNYEINLELIPNSFNSRVGIHMDYSLDGGATYTGSYFSSYSEIGDNFTHVNSWLSRTAMVQMGHYAELGGLVSPTHVNVKILSDPTSSDVKIFSFDYFTAFEQTATSSVHHNIGRRYLYIRSESSYNALRFKTASQRFDYSNVQVYGIYT